MKKLNITILVLTICFCVSSLHTYGQGTDIFSPYNKLFTTIKSLDKSIADEKQSLRDTSKIQSDTDKISHQVLLIQAYQLKQYPDSAWNVLRQCKKMIEPAQRKFCSEYDYWWIAKTYYDQQQKDKAQIWLDSAIIRLQNSPALDIRQAYTSTLSSLLKQTNNFNIALKYQAISDSLLLVIRQDDFKAKLDSVASLMNKAKDSLYVNEKKMEAKQAEFDAKSNYWLIAFSIIVFLPLCFVIYFFLRGRKKKSVHKQLTAEPQPTSEKKQVVPADNLKSDITNIYGLAGLLLEKPRSGEDLTYLKSIQTKALELFRQLRPDAAHLDNEELDDDKIIRRLKGISVLIVSADATTLLMLKEYLRKKIRLCTINAINTTDGIDTTVADVIIADDIKDELNHIKSTPVIYISSDGSRGIRKPFVIDELLQALMDVYEPSVKNDIEVREEIKAEEIAGKESLTKLEQLNKEFSEARLSKNKERIFNAVKDIRKNIEDDSNKKWFDTVLLHNEELSDLQLELALRNIQTFLQRRI